MRLFGDELLFFSLDFGILLFGLGHGLLQPLRLLGEFAGIVNGLGSHLIRAFTFVLFLLFPIFFLLLGRFALLLSDQGSFDRRSLGVVVHFNLRLDLVASI